MQAGIKYQTNVPTSFKYQSAIDYIFGITDTISGQIYEPNGNLTKTASLRSIEAVSILLLLLKIYVCFCCEFLIYFQINRNQRKSFQCPVNVSKKKVDFCQQKPSM